MIEMGRPSEYRANWQREVHDFIEHYRWPIIAEIIDTLNRPFSSSLHGLQRHAEWEAEVLGRQPDAQSVLDLLRLRRGEIDGDLETERSIADALRLHFACSGTESNQIPSREMVQYVLDATGERYAPNKLKTFLERLKVPGLSRGRTNRGVHYEWRDPERHAATPRPR